MCRYFHILYLAIRGANLVERNEEQEALKLSDIEYARKSLHAADSEIVQAIRFLQCLENRLAE